MKNETTLGAVPVNSYFWFGGIKFEKISADEETETTHCRISGQEAFVYISNAAWVSLIPTKAADVTLWLVWGDDEDNDDFDFESEPIVWPFETLPNPGDKIDSTLIAALINDPKAYYSDADYWQLQYTLYEDWNAKGQLIRCMKLKAV